MDVVEVNGLRVRTEVGFSAHELGKKQELQITLQLKLSIKKAGKTDQVKDTVDYKAITKDVTNHVENKTFYLIETVATDVAYICVVCHGVPSVRVTVHKPHSLRFAEGSTVSIERCWEDFEWNEAHISIGSNIRPLENIPHAISLLRTKVEVIKLSKSFWTKAVQTRAETEDFVNMAALIKTKLDIVGLKQVLLDIEHRLGRNRPAHNAITGVFPLDMDICFWGSDVKQYKLADKPEEKLRQVPHPETLTSAHVIIPMADVTPEYVHPKVNKSLRTMAVEIRGKEDFSSSLRTVKDRAFLDSLYNDKIEHGTSKYATSPSMNEGGSKLSMPLQNGCHQFSEIKERVALVTGAAKRIGACIARKLHASGFRVVIHYNRSESDARDFAKKLNSLRSNSATLVQGDLSRDVSRTAQRIINEAVGAWGRLDVLVNNASQFYPTYLGSVTEEVWNDMMQPNLASPFFLSQAAFPILKASCGSIVNLCDIHGNRPKTSHSVYCISKAGLHMCTLSMAKEFAPHVRVNGVSPGFIIWPEDSGNETLTKDVRESCMKEKLRQQQESIAKIPFGRKGEPENIADVVLFLAKSAEYITGQIIAVDGGRSLHQ